MSRHSYRQLIRLSSLLVLVSTIWYFFSPWKLVIELRPTSETGIDVLPGETKSHSIATVIKPLSGKKDSIKQEFGNLEEQFLAAVDQPSKPPKRSRDDSIKFIYDVKTPEDWLDLVESQDSHGFMALTKITQRYLYNKQNPESCKDQKFIVLNHFGGDQYGIGALVQHIADYLSIAVQTNSILIYSTNSSPGQNFIEEDASGNRACGRSLDCIFQEVSKCKADVKMKEGQQSVFVSADSNEAIDYDLDVPAYLKKTGSPIPVLFETALKKLQPDITGEMLKYWWRAQAAGYLMRLNSGAAKSMKRMRLGEGVEQLGIQWDLNSEAQNISFPFPMPEGTISMHVRHGDKGSEMRLVPFNDYVVKAEKFLSVNPLGYWKRGFLSTEDPNVIEQMKSMARVLPFTVSSSNARWTWYWSDIPRINTGPETQLAQFGNRTELTLKWLLQLVMAIECDAFIGTRGSGWNRLIDSLRCVWLASCKQPFLEVGFENDWTGYGP